jgi:hypothetical protein
MHNPTAGVDDAFTVAGSARAACSGVPVESPSVSAPRAHLVTSGGGAAGEANQQAAQLASWEDEGGTTSSSRLRTV